MKRRLWPALLFALLLPLQGFAFVSGCGARPAASAEHCHPHAPDGAGTTAQHHCGTCCCMATATSVTVTWRPAPPGRTALMLARLPAPLTLTLDRLDRPPRLTAA